MAKAGVAVDNWKLPVFRRRLEAAGYTYEDGGPLPGDCTLLKVETQEVGHLQVVLEACQAECRAQRK